MITEVHAASRGTYGAPRVHAELRLGRGIVVGHDQVGVLMRNAGLAGLLLKRRFRRNDGMVTAADLVDRNFTRPQPNQLWVTDIERHEAFLNLAVVKGHRHVLVAAGALTLRAA